MNTFSNTYSYKSNYLSINIFMNKCVCVCVCACVCVYLKTET